MKCVDVCRYEALQVTGKAMGISEILDEVERDRPFYNNSGGGMTVSGGEPTVHPAFYSGAAQGGKGAFDTHLP
ncbi:MAG: hypothetical protein MZV70_39000 [Desulfobacterales bacterium]|nr:hypothetical protein [Desulfobacterales bacterium]